MVVTTRAMTHAQQQQLQQQLDELATQLEDANTTGQQLQQLVNQQQATLQQQNAAIQALQQQPAAPAAPAAPAQVARPRSRDRVSIEPYLGRPGDDFDQWIEREFLTAARAQDWDDPTKARKIAAYLKSAALDSYLESDQNIRNDWGQVLQYLRDHLQQAGLQDAYEAALLTLEQPPGQSALEYSYQVERIVCKAYAGRNYNAAQIDHACKFHYKRGLRSPRLKELIAAQNPLTFAAMVQLAVRMEGTIPKEIAAISTPVSTAISPVNAVAAAHPSNPAIASELLAMFQKLVELCREMDQLGFEPPPPPHQTFPFGQFRWGRQGTPGGRCFFRSGSAGWRSPAPFQRR